MADTACVELPQPAAFIDALPPEFRHPPYVYDRFPGANGVATVDGGANCQFYAYEVLRLLGYRVPPLRSSDLWEDVTATEQVTTPRRLDPMLFGPTPDAYGAHVGVYLGDDQVLHLSAQVGQPAIWPLDQFQERPEYQVVIGIKRPTVRDQ